MKTSDIIKPLRPHLKHRALPLAALALATAFGLNSAQAYSVVWETAKDTTADTDVVTTEGTLVRAVAGSPLAGYGATVNGIEFTPYAMTPSNEYSWNGTQYNALTWGVAGAGGWTDSLAKTPPDTNFWGLGWGHGYFANVPPSGLSEAYARALGGVRYSGEPATMTLGGLTVGQSYLVQLWSMDTRGSANGMPLMTMYLDGNPSTAMLTNRGLSGDPGQNIIGRFVANSTVQSFTLTGAIVVNAYQLRTIDPLPTDPVVAITSPADTATVSTTFTISATAGAPRGTITSVSFSYSTNGGTDWSTPIVDTEVPYSCTFSSVPNGPCQIKAVAVDNDNHSNTAMVNVTVADTAPTVAITSPVDAGYAAPDFTIRATATGIGAITHVDFYDGTTQIGTDDTPPYTCAVTGAKLGAHELTAKAYDNGSQEATSAAVHVTVVKPVAIEWDPAQNTTADTDVVTTGTLVRAAAGSTLAGYGATVNGVEFTPYAVTPSNEYGWNGPQYNTLSWGVAGAGGWTDSLAKTPPTTNDYGLNSRNGYYSNIPPSGSEMSDAYKKILFGVRDSGASTTMTLGGLTVGQSYLVQLWSMDPRNIGRRTMYLDGILGAEMLTARSNGDPGQYIIGRFAANSTEQSFTLTGDAVLINAYQLRAISGVTDSSYNAWATVKYGLTDGAADRGADPDGDGFTNLQEFMFGTSPVAANGTLTTSETLADGLVLHWLQRASGCTYLFQESITMSAGDWSPSAIVPEPDVDQSGVPDGYVRYKATISIGVAQKFFRVESTEN